MKSELFYNILDVAEKADMFDMKGFMPNDEQMTMLEADVEYYMPLLAYIATRECRTKHEKEMHKRANKALSRIKLLK